MKSIDALVPLSKDDTTPSVEITEPLTGLVEKMSECLEKNNDIMQSVAERLTNNDTTESDTDAETGKEEE